ncbi:MAG: LUD domain-containing protein [Ferruginibacter sp.]|nr:LUD domain-containing protein [Ferruginibacter sp.]
MGTSQAKENILQRIKQALIDPVPLPFPLSDTDAHIFHAPTEDLEVIFAREFTGLQGKFAFCLNEADLQHQLQVLISEKNWTRIYCTEEPWAAGFSNTADLAGCNASITGCEFLVARTGSIIMSSAQQSGRTVSVYAPIHICIAYTDQLIFNISDGLKMMQEKYKHNLPSLITLASGPSRTADIEKTLVTGVHGPAEVYLFLVESRV